MLEVTGSIPVGAQAATRAVAVVNPTIFFAQSLKDALVARGIAVSGEAVDCDDVAAESWRRRRHAPRRARSSTQSPPLREIATVLMKVSQNLYAETLLKAIGAARGGLGTTQAGASACAKTLDRLGHRRTIATCRPTARVCRATTTSPPRRSTAVLEHMYKDPRHRDAFVATLPIAGKDGTIATRMRRTRAEGNAVAKTGSIANVRSLSGLRADARRRDARLLDPRQRLRHSRRRP